MTRELDVRVAKALGRSEPPELHQPGWCWEENEDGTWQGEYWFDPRGWISHIWPPPYSTNIAAAWTLTAHRDLDVYLDFQLDNTRLRWYCLFGEDLDNGQLADTAPEAICKAFLVCVGGG